MKTLLQVLGLCVFQTVDIFVEKFGKKFTEPGNAMLVNLCGASIWREENSLNIWNLLWLSR